MENDREQRRTIKAAVVVIVVMILIIFFLTILGDSEKGLVLEELLIGWASFMTRVLPQAQVRWDGILTFVIGFVVATVCFHSMVTWFLKERAKASQSRSGIQVKLGHDDLKRVWRIRTSLASLTMVLLIFVVGISMAGIVHQTGWLLSSPYPLTVTPIQSDDDAAMSTYDREKTPPGLSWVASISVFAGYIGIADSNDRDLPFHAPANAAYFKRYFPTVLCPSQGSPIQSQEGFALSHVAANPNLLGKTFNEVPSSPFAMFGEVNAGFMPWGDPSNHRNLELGIRRSWKGTTKGQVGYGSLHTGGANLVLSDLSVAFQSEKTDPIVLKQLAGANPNRP
jgi:hypothetical protein